jgi:hypothetical protein
MDMEIDHIEYGEWDRSVMIVWAVRRWRECTSGGRRPERVNPFYPTVRTVWGRKKDQESGGTDEEQNSQGGKYLSRPRLRNVKQTNRS